VRPVECLAVGFRTSGSEFWMSSEVKMTGDICRAKGVTPHKNDILPYGALYVTTKAYVDTLITLT